MSVPVSVQDLHFAYPGGLPVLDGVSLDIRAGERVALLGANGAGKSTLLLQLNGLLQPVRGHVEIDGVAVSDETARDVRRTVGLVFQDPDDQLFLPSLLEDVAFGPLNSGIEPSDAERMATDMLREFGLDHAAHRAAHHLSGGEKRLASLATVLVSEPGVLALDEPTAGLDAPSRSRVVRALDRPETLLVATHDLDVARALCPRSVALQDGRVAYDGPTTDLLDDGPRLRALGLAVSL